MKVRITVEAEIGDLDRLLSWDRLHHFTAHGDFADPESIGAAVYAALVDSGRGPAPLDLGLEIVAHQTEELAEAGESPTVFADALRAWQQAHPPEADARRFQQLLERLEELDDDSVLDELVHDLAS